MTLVKSAHKKSSFLSISATTIVAVSAILPVSSICAAVWPCVKSFDSEHVLRVAMPMGGIGCGSISLSGRGEIVDWEIMNRPNKTLSESEHQNDSRTFFAIRAKSATHKSVTMLAN